MGERKTLYLGLVLAAVLSALNLVALKFYLYWPPKENVFGFDSFMHFFGGLTLGVLSVWFMNAWRTQRSLLAVFFLVLLLGGVWEVFEYVFGIAGVSGDVYWIDTIHDLVMDGLGATVAFLLVTSRPQQLS